jgi:hypothetical protein
MDTNISYPNFGDSIPWGCWLIIGVHSNTKSKCQAFKLKHCRLSLFWPLTHFIWVLFNATEHAVSCSKDDPSFNLHAVNNNGIPPLCASMLTLNQHASIESGVYVGYYLHRANDNPNILAGSAVIHLDGLCPAFDPTDNPNLFSHLFGIEFMHNSHVYVRVISQFEIASYLRLSDELTYKLSHPSHSFCLDALIPGLTPAQIFDQMHDRCLHI